MGEAALALPLLFLFGAAEAQQALVLFLFELLRPLGGPAHSYGREDDDESNEKGVEELGGQCPSRLAQELVEQQLDGVVSGQRGYETQSGSYQLRGFVQYLTGHRFLLNFFSFTLGHR